MRVLGTLGGLNCLDSLGCGNFRRLNAGNTLGAANVLGRSNALGCLDRTNSGCSHATPSCEFLATSLRSTVDHIPCGFILYQNLWVRLSCLDHEDQILNAKHLA